MPGLRTIRYDERGLKGRKSLKGKRGGCYRCSLFCVLLAYLRIACAREGVKGAKEVVKGYKA